MFFKTRESHFIICGLKHYETAKLRTAKDHGKRRPSAIIVDEDLAMLAIYENISFLPPPTIADSLRSSAMNQKSLFLAIIADGEKLMRTLSAIIADEV